MAVMHSVVLPVLLTTVVWGFAVPAAAQVEGAPRPAAAVAPGAVSRAKIALDKKVFDFGRVGMGAVIRHEFIFTNTGAAALTIKDVRPGCGCTAAGEWTREVEPGRTGVIPLELNTAGFLNEISKATVVQCNDPEQPIVRLEMKGTVWRAFDVKPGFVLFRLSDEAPTNETKVVKIVSQLEEPVALVPPQSTNASFRAELRVVRPGREFELAITTVPPLAPGYTRNVFQIETSSAEAPRMIVTAQATVLKAVQLSPERIVLPPGPMPTARTNRVSVRNNGPDPLALSEARVDLPGTVARIEEVQPGRLFWVAVSFPPGFQLEPRHTGELSFRSNHPRYPLLRVPVADSQSAVRPAVAPAGATPASAGARSATGGGTEGPQP